MIDDIRPRYLESMEETMVDMVQKLAALVEVHSVDGELNLDPLRLAMANVEQRTFSATIYNWVKTSVNVRVYVTDAAGIVLYDSDNARDVGKDYSKWNDVYLTLRGGYGVRSVSDTPEIEHTSRLYVSAPIRYQDEIIGVLTVSKPSTDSRFFIEQAQQSIRRLMLIVGVVLVTLMGILVLWFTYPIQQLIHYVHRVTQGQKVALPTIRDRDMKRLGLAVEDLKTALDGRQYIETYVQNMTHQIKSPLTAIRGFSELLEDPRSEPDRIRFLATIQSECQRIQDIIDKLLLLSSLENQTTLDDVESIDLVALVTECTASFEAATRLKGVTFSITGKSTAMITGDRFLVRHAMSNVLHNAIEFTPVDGQIDIAIESDDAGCSVVICDTGPGIPDYALSKVFDTFYSLPRPVSNKKSSGLGLCLVREVMLLHQGQVAVSNQTKGGAAVRLWFQVGGHH